MQHAGMIEQQAIAALNLPANWKARSFRTLYGNTPRELLECSGDGVTFTTTEAALREFAARWERDTGRCNECMGEGKTLKRWSRDTGAEYRPCRRCNGTGSPNHAGPAGTSEE